MSKFIRILVETTTDAFYNVVNFIQNNLLAFANILNLVIPYVMYFVGQTVAIDRGKISVGGEIVFPIVFIIIIYYIKSAANKLGKGITIPLPSKRFTEVSDDGEVSIENERLQELILYTADLEDWLDRKGLL